MDDRRQPPFLTSGAIVLTGMNANTEGLAVRDAASPELEPARRFEVVSRRVPTATVWDMAHKEAKEPIAVFLGENCTENAAAFVERLNAAERGKARIN
jgi:hypothetical protein